MKTILAIALCGFAFSAVAQPIIRTTPFTKEFLTNSTAQQASDYLGTARSHNGYVTNLVVDYDGEVFYGGVTLVVGNHAAGTDPGGFFAGGEAAMSINGLDEDTDPDSGNPYWYEGQSTIYFAPYDQRNNTIAILRPANTGDLTFNSVGTGTVLYFHQDSLDVDFGDNINVGNSGYFSGDVSCVNAVANGDLTAWGYTQLQSTTATLMNADSYTVGVVTSILTGTGSPQNVVSANRGSIYLRQDGGTSTTLYVKESGSGNTGWVAK